MPRNIFKRCIFGNHASLLTFSDYPECGLANPNSPNTRKCHLAKGTLSSPAYPKPYQTDSVYIWEIVTEPNTYIALKILEFDVPSETTGSECYYTYLGFYDTIKAGLVGDIEDRKQYFCNRRVPTSEPVLSPFNELFVVLQTSSVPPGKGFKAQYESINFHSSIHFNMTAAANDGKLYSNLR